MRRLIPRRNRRAATRRRGGRGMVRGWYQAAYQAAAPIPRSIFGTDAVPRGSKNGTPDLISIQMILCFQIFTTLLPLGPRIAESEAQVDLKGLPAQSLLAYQGGRAKCCQGSSQ